jgi:precorrin-6A/cobalt-precorrin-6A reductase
VLVSKDSGGAYTVAKLDAARDLGIPVVIIARPPHPPVHLVRTVADATAWCRAAVSFCDAPASRGLRL